MVQGMLAFAAAPARERRQQVISMSILDQYLLDAPSPATAFALFKGEWSSLIPGIGEGNVSLFNDVRVTWLESQCGGFAGKRVLELGPLEGGHSYMLAQRGAHVTAIEANTRAFMKCLIVKNALKFDVDFQLGDFRPYLSATSDRYDFLLASGVLYHMTDPVQLLVDATRVSNALGVWTHYFDADIISRRADLTAKFEMQGTPSAFEGRDYMIHKQNYEAALDWNGFCGGSAPTSHWLEKQSLLGLLDARGFDVRIGADEREHPNGPAMLFYAKRR